MIKTLKTQWNESFLPDIGIWSVLLMLQVLAAASSHGSNWMGQVIVIGCVGCAFMCGRTLVMRRMTREMEKQSAHLFSAMKSAYVVGLDGRPEPTPEEMQKEIQIQNAMHRAPKSYEGGVES